MAEERVKRRLAAILVADVVGFSRLMSDDEEGTLATLKAYRRVIDGLMQVYEGRVFGGAGDSLIAEFSSPVEAVRCASEIQRRISDENAYVKDHRRMLFRIGVNLGDVIVEDDNLYGDGVNIAARLEAIAEPGGIWVSGTVFDHVKGKVELVFENVGDRRVKNIADPVRVYRVKESTGGVTARLVDQVLTYPTVAVLPFVNLGGDAEQQYFADGITEDIITALSRWRWFPVIARNSTFSYKGQSVEIWKVAAELGARYVLEGSVRRGGDRIRVSAQLIDATSGHHVWAGKFDRTLADVFELQDEITQRIAAIVAPELERAEHKRIAIKGTQSLSAWEYCLRGTSCLHEMTKNGNARARDMFQKAIELDPVYSDAYTGLAFAHHRDVLLQVADNPEESRDLALEYARQAVLHDPASSNAQVILGIAYQHAEEFDDAIAATAAAVSLNPSNALAHVALGVSLSSADRPEEGIPHLEKSLELSPRDPSIHLFASFLAWACLDAREYDRAEASARKAVRLRPEYPDAHLCLAVCLGHLGRTKEAKAELDECDRLHHGFVDKMVSEEGFARAARVARVLEGLRKAGWPASLPD